VTGFREVLPPPTAVPMPMPLEAPPPWVAKMMARRMKHQQVQELMKLYYFCCKHGMYAEAEEIAAKAHGIEPHNVAVQAAVGVALRLAKKAAAGPGSKCTSKDRTRVEVPAADRCPGECKKTMVSELVNLSTYYLKQQHFGAARMYAQKAMELDPGNKVAAELFHCATDCCRQTGGPGGAECHKTPDAESADCCPGQVHEVQSASHSMVCRVYPVGQFLEARCVYGETGDHYTCTTMCCDSGESLVKMIRMEISPQSWSEVGGPGTITYFPLGQVILVQQTPDVQEQIADMLATLRRMQRAGK
jgi:hypothetical protein